ncbi:AAA family ATPase [Arthrobacter sp. D1-29]
MRLVMLGGAPGVGKTSVARALLRLIAGGGPLVQWIDVDALWQHQPWRVDDRTKLMLQRNLQALLANASAAGVDVVIVTWVYQNGEFHKLVAGLAPMKSDTVTIQLRASASVWHERFTLDSARPAIDDFFEHRYLAAQSTPADYIIETDELSESQIATKIFRLLNF